MSAFIDSTQRTNALGSLGNSRLADAVHDDPVALLLDRQPAPAAGEHVHLGALLHEVLGELAHVSRQSAFDDRRVLPGDQQGAHAAALTLPFQRDHDERARHRLQSSAGGAP